MGFDLVIAQLGFGMSPWSPLVVAAVGAVAWWAVESEDKRGLLLALWFFVPLVAVMAGFRTGNHFLFAGVPAAAACVGLFAERVVRRGVPAYFLAIALVMMYVVLRHDLKEYPASMVSWLTWEHPFAKDGQNRFPETLAVSSGIRWALLAAGLLAAAHFGGASRARACVSSTGCAATRRRPSPRPRPRRRSCRARRGRVSRSGARWS